MLPIFVAADQFAYVFAAGAIASPGDLLVDKLLQVIWQRNIHSAHRAKIASMAKFGKVPFPQREGDSRSGRAVTVEIERQLQISPAFFRSMIGWNSDPRRTSKHRDMFVTGLVGTICFNIWQPDCVILYGISGKFVRFYDP